MTITRKIPAPRVLPESQAYWSAADEGRLLLKKCNDCGEVHHYPRDICPFCLSADTDWQQAAGTGSVYSFSTMGKADAAYTIAFVTLDEGVTMMTNLVDCDPKARCADRPARGWCRKATQRGGRPAVQVVFTPSLGGHAVAMSRPPDGETDADNHASRTAVPLHHHRRNARARRPDGSAAFADMGARVIKLEIPAGAPGGDDMIGGRDHNRADYENLHRNKESLTLNMKQPEGVAILHELVKQGRRVHRELPARRQAPARHRPRRAACHQPAARLRQHLGFRPGRAVRQLAGLRLDRAGHGRADERDRQARRRAVARRHPDR